MAKLIPGAVRLPRAPGRVRRNSNRLVIEEEDSNEVLTKTADYTASVNDKYIVMSPQSGTLTLTLPPIADAHAVKQILWVKNIHETTHTVTIEGNGAETIDGATNISISPEGAAIIAAWTNTDWKQISSFP